MMRKGIILILTGVFIFTFCSMVKSDNGSETRTYRGPSDSISYFAPCWGKDNKIYFIKHVEFGYALDPDNSFIDRLLFLGGNWACYDSKFFLCSMNYDGTDKKEIKEIFGKKARKMYKKKYKKVLEVGHSDPYMDYCEVTNKLVYCSGNSGIWVINADGTEETCISQDGQHPSWSPDGKRAVYRMHIIKGEKDKEGFFRGPLEDYDSLWIMDAEGSNNHKIFSEEVDKWIESPIWSPKGDLIAFVCKGWIWVMKPDGSERRKVIDGRCCSWWIDGKLLLVEGGKLVDLVPCRYSIDVRRWRGIKWGRI